YIIFRTLETTTTSPHDALPIWKVGVHRCPVAGRFRRLSGRTRSVGRCVRLVGPNSFGQRLCQAEQVRPYGRNLRGLGVPSLRTRARKSTRLNSSHVKISYAVFC